MGPSSCGIYIVESEISVVLMAMKRGNLWNSNTHQDTNTERLIMEVVCLTHARQKVSNIVDLTVLRLAFFKGYK